MQKPLKIFLFDVDGVIIDPVAYKMGINKTLELLCNKMGLSNTAELLPQKTEIAYLESCGIHDDWDISNILFAFILVSICDYFKKNKQLVQLADMDLDNKLLAIKLLCPNIQRPNYMQFAHKLVTDSDLSHPPDVALGILSSELENKMRELNSAGWIDLLRDFLIGTRSAYASHGTRLFQNIILGKHAFEKTYGLVSEWDGSALLQTEDKVLLSADSIKKINELTGSNDHKFAVYTARPSLPPDLNQAGYSPEAEMAVQAAQLTNIPLIGSGTMQWLAEKYSERPEDLVKPNSTQAISALLAALTQSNDVSILENAYRIDKQGVHPDQTLFSQFKNQNMLIYVFEDITSGVQAVLSAVEKLQARGYKVSVKPLGIAQDKNKKESLEKYCHKIFYNVNEALEFAFAD